jgi:adhesin HecA-like repeat protein
VRRLAALAAATALTLLVVIVGKSEGKPAEAAAVVRSGDTVTVTGPKIALTHGIVQVRVTITGGRITDAAALSLPHDNPHSWAGSSGAAVKLRAEVLANQTGKIDSVSGATYTSGGYIRSLQAALDAAGHR